MGLVGVLLYLALLGVLGAVVLVFYQYKQGEARKLRRSRLMESVTKAKVPVPIPTAPTLASTLARQVVDRYAAAGDTNQIEVVPVRAESASFYEAARLSPWDAVGHLRNGDINAARLAMQKLSYIVYENKKKHPENVAAFTQLMCLFVQIDPLFHLGLAAIQPVVLVSPGIRQTALYNYMPMDNELARYVMYFAHETGHVVRRKKGNSYEVFLPGQAMPEPITKSKRSRSKSV